MWVTFSELGPEGPEALLVLPLLLCGLAFFPTMQWLRMSFLSEALGFPKLSDGTKAKLDGACLDIMQPSKKR